MDDLLPPLVLGLPLHPLLVHVTVVLVPLTAILVLLSAVVPRIRRWARWLPMALSFVCIPLAPLSTGSGENLTHAQGGPTPLIQRHAQLGDMLLWWLIGLFLVATANYLVYRRGRKPSTAIAVILAVLGVAAPIGAFVQTVLTGHTGAESVWSAS